ncbi:MAG: polymer-forming cytoskeletal protein [Chloroflexi bacterium]|nr:polymer-forming cytoskeletal protein [Chloroflexota bacterium]MCI0579016.1 polymer-forming cytoskeletal protein [Chloroflexota bacterium]MCI0644803.1 polymer-forming cytoskeletal protein [Chloroflexota bacterium]MCI0731978.1 polymer-forming cytoskeletal protein [Chloroflexota bacterium]
MKRLAIILPLLLVLLLLLPAGTALAGTHFDRIIKSGESVDEDITITGGRLVVEEGATVNGEVVIFGGTAEVAGTINGNVSIFGGSTELSGQVNGDLVVFGGDLTVNTAAGVDGECVLLGGSLEGDGQSGITCTESSGWPDFVKVPSPPLAPKPPVPPHIPPVRVAYEGGFLDQVGQVAGRSLILGLLALVMAALLPGHLAQVSDVVRRKPVASGTVGLLTAVAGPSLIALLAVLSGLLSLICVGILGFPIVIVLSVILGAALLVGWVAVGNLLGERLAVAMNLTNRTLPVTAALGTAVLTLATGFLSLLPFWLGGWLWALAAFVLACAGLGAVALTKFGSRPYPLTVKVIE